MLTKTYAAALVGIDACKITAEVNVSSGQGVFMVGLPDNAVRESLQRIESALKVNNWRWPSTKIVINLAPADIRKEGSAYDLPLAMGVLAASGQLPLERLSDYLMMGELSLDGGLVGIKGMLPIAISAKREGFKGVIVPRQNAREAALVEGLEVYGANHLNDVVEFLTMGTKLQPTRVDVRAELAEGDKDFPYDFNEIKGQESVKRAMEIAAAGGHNILMIGSPGSGKSMVAKRLPSILPPLTLEEALEATKIHSVAGKVEGMSLVKHRPFRSPHHTISDVALVGGGTFPQPGEISLAHNGVLFLDELPEFKRSVLEVMRQPLEDRTICISRANSAVEYPASFMLVASMNPCPCGYYNTPNRTCTCSPGAVAKYLGRISGPLLDRIDLHVQVLQVPYKKLSDDTRGESSENIRLRVIRAREVQRLRFEDCPGIHCNAQMTSKLMQRYAQMSAEAKEILGLAIQRLSLSARAYDRIIKVSRTIADLAGCEEISSAHIGEAVQYRTLDRDIWKM